jgi:hypothetical protein
MTSERATRANRSNAKASTGPRTRAGKARSGQNARKHGLSAAGSNPKVDAEVARIVELIIGEYGGDEVTRDAARSLAEAQVQVRSVRAYKVALLRNSVLSRGSDRGLHDETTARVIWRGGAVSQLAIKRAAGRVEALTRGAEMRDRIVALARSDIPDEEIAARLTGEGHRSPGCTERVLPVTVRRIRQQAGLGPRTPRSRWRHASDLLGVQALARRLNIPTKWF